VKSVSAGVKTPPVERLVGGRLFNEIGVTRGRVDMATPYLQDILRFVASIA
jgi:hypothetical protein